MTDEEMVEDYVRKQRPDVVNWDGGEPDERFYNELRLREAFLAGFKACNPEWHDLRKDPNDLPKHSGLYCSQCGEVREYVKEEKSWFTVNFEPCMNRTQENLFMV